MIKERKRTYTQEEVNELKKWFDSQELPPTMQKDKDRKSTRLNSSHAR